MQFQDPTKSTTNSTTTLIDKTGTSIASYDTGTVPTGYRYFGIFVKALQGGFSGIPVTVTGDQSQYVYYSGTTGPTGLVDYCNIAPEMDTSYTVYFGGVKNYELFVVGLVTAPIIEATFATAQQILERGTSQYLPSASIGGGTTTNLYTGECWLEAIVFGSFGTTNYVQVWDSSGGSGPLVAVLGTDTSYRSNEVSWPKPLHMTAGVTVHSIGSASNIMDIAASIRLL